MKISPRGVNLPSGLNLTREDVDRVCGALVSDLKGDATPRRCTRPSYSIPSFFTRYLNCRNDIPSSSAARVLL